MDQYQVVEESDTIGLTEKEAQAYFKANHVEVPHTTYYKLLKRIRARKEEMVRYVAKNLPSVHITQIESLRLMRKRLYMKFLSETDTKKACELANTILNIETKISEYNGWTQRITEETIRKYGTTTKTTTEEITIHSLTG